MNATVRRLLVVSALVTVSLVPSVLLFMLFGELNTAAVDRPEVKLGGPIAAFAITLYGLWHMYEKTSSSENVNEARLQVLAGRWRIESKSSGSQRRASSLTTIAVDGGEMQISGGTFFAVAADGSRGDPIGNWTVEMAVSDGQRLKYFYSLTDNLANHSTWKGLVEVSLQQGAATPTFEGTWQVVGKEHHGGTISLVSV